MRNRTISVNTASVVNQIEDLQIMWEVLFPSQPIPSEQQFRVWLISYDFDSIYQAIRQAGIRCLRSDMVYAHLVRFVSDVAGRTLSEKVGQQPQQPRSPKGRRKWNRL